MRAYISTKISDLIGERDFNAALNLAKARAEVQNTYQLAELAFNCGYIPRGLGQKNTKDTPTLARPDPGPSEESLEAKIERLRNISIKGKIPHKRTPVALPNFDQPVIIGDAYQQMLDHINRVIKNLYNLGEYVQLLPILEKRSKMENMEDLVELLTMCGYKIDKVKTEDGTCLVVRKNTLEI